MVLGAQLWPLSAIFDLRRLAARTGREHGNDVVCPLLLTSEINERYSLPFLCPTHTVFLQAQATATRGESTLHFDDDDEASCFAANQG